MPFTQQEIDNIAALTLNNHLNKGEVLSQEVQEQPLYNDLRKMQKENAGTREDLTVNVKGKATTVTQGFEADDTVTYGNPANTKQAKFQQKNIHAGIMVTLDELSKNGISIQDTTTGEGKILREGREKIALADLLDEKLEDMTEGFHTGQNETIWGDGTADAKKFAGIRSIIVDDPTAVLNVGGLPQGTLTWWRNRAKLDLVGGNFADQPIISFLNKEMRQLRRYAKGRAAKHYFYAGSDMIDQLEKEIRANGQYTTEGYKGKTELSMGDIVWKNKVIRYDPTLDDLGMSKRLYIPDMGAIRLRPIKNENMKRHNPARPANKYVLYKAVTWMGGMTCDRRNTSGVYAFT